MSSHIMKTERLVLFMREKTYHIYLDSHEKKILLHSLVELKNQLMPDIFSCFIGC